MPSTRSGLGSRKQPRRAAKSKEHFLRTDSRAVFGFTSSSSKVTKRKRKPTPRNKTKPTYNVMVSKALIALDKKEDGRNYCSAAKIGAFIQRQYPVPDGYLPYVKRTLKKGVEGGTYLQNKQSYRISAKGRRHMAPAKPKKRKAKKRAAPAKKRKATKKRAPAKKKTSAAARRAATKKSAAAKAKEARKARRVARASAAEERSGSAYKWQYSSRDGGWHDYDEEASRIVESAYQEYLSNPGLCDVRSVHSGQWHYQVDFLNNKQTNVQHASHTVRDIRRVKA